MKRAWLLAGAFLAFLPFMPPCSALLCLTLDGANGRGEVWMDEGCSASATGNITAYMCGNTAVFAEARQDAFLSFGWNVDIAAKHVSMNITVEESGSPPLDPEERIADMVETPLPQNATFDLFCGMGSRIILYGEQMCSVDAKSARDMTLRLCPEGTEIYPMEPEGYDLKTVRLPGYWYVPRPTASALMNDPKLGFDGNYRLMICGPDAVVPCLNTTLLTGIWETREKGYWYDETTGMWLGPGTHRLIRVEYIDVEIKLSRFDMLFEGFTVEAYPEVADYWLDGELFVPSASGSFEVEGETYPVNDEDVRITGDFLIQPRGEEGGIAMHCSNEFSSIVTPGASWNFTGAAALSAVVVAAGALAALLHAAKKGIFALPFWTRITNGNVLKSDNRRTIYALVMENPGICKKRLAEMSGMGWGTIDHHLSVLKREGYVATLRRSGKSMCFPGGYGRCEKAKAAVLKDERNKRLAAIVAESPGITQKEAAVLIGLPQSTASEHMSLLVNAELVERRREGRNSRFYPL